MDLVTTSWHSYPSIYNLGHRAVSQLLDYPHIVQEKVDGSQFSFGVFDQDGERILRVRSKGAEMVVDAPEKMFNAAVATAKALAPDLHVGWTYRAEYLQKPKHNTLVYDRIPDKHLILFDVSTGDQTWLSYDELLREGARLGLEVVCVFNQGTHGYTKVTYDWLRGVLDTTQSILGGQLIEGVVIKPTVEVYGSDKKTLMGKFVSERFREAHVHAWKETSPNSGDILDRLAKTYTTKARWMKAVQHLREGGQLEGSPRDIGKLIIETKKDFGKEEKENIMQALWKWAWPHLERRVTAGMPEWYKNELLRAQFEVTSESPVDDTAVPSTGQATDASPMREVGTTVAV